MKLIQIRLHFEYADRIEAILDGRGIDNWIRVPLIHGRDPAGKHDGSQAFPGLISLVEASVEDERVDALLEDLRAFRERKKAHRHLEALVLPVERRLTDEDGPSHSDSDEKEK